MKKLLLSALMLIGLTLNTQAQKIRNAEKISKNAIGLRLAASDGIGIDASYQRAVLTNNRLEFDLGVRNNSHSDAVKLAALFQWTWNIDRGLNWYVGAGGGLGSYRHAYGYNKHYYDYYYDNYPYGGYPEDKGTFAFAAGDIGIEYDFDIPLQLAFDVRPEVGSDDFYDDTIGVDVGLAVRYRF
jgi:hypothetical protein